MPRLIAQMVIRNEVDRYLERVLTRLKDQVDLLVVTDDCSDDGSADVARSFGAKVHVMDQPTFVRDESLLRQTAWDFLGTFARSNDWILAIDADEEFYPDARLYRFLNQSRFPVLGVTFYHMWNETHYRVDKAWKPTVSSRLFKYQPGGQFRRTKLACGSEPTYVADNIRRGKAYWNTGMRMKHLGYLRDDDKRAKYDRYMELDHGDFHSLQHIRSIVDPYPELMEWQD